MSRAVAAAAVVLLALAACGPDKAETVRPGSYCQQAGVKAQSEAGRPVVCTTTSADDKLRWRAR
ncbi:MAG: hypothetical protein WA890_15305 [Micromonospora sp.]